MKILTEMRDIVDNDDDDSAATLLYLNFKWIELQLMDR